MIRSLIIQFNYQFMSLKLECKSPGAKIESPEANCSRENPTRALRLKMIKNAKVNQKLQELEVEENGNSTCQGRELMKMKMKMELAWSS